MAPSGALLFSKRGPAFGNFSVSGYHFLLVDVFWALGGVDTVTFTLYHITYWALISMWGPQYGMALSWYLGLQMSMWKVNLWGPQYDALALSRCGALGV